MSDENTPITRTVKVAGVETKSGGEDTEKPWTKYTLVDENGKKQATFDKRVGLFLSSMIGKFVEITIEKSGRYWNLTSAKPADGPAPASAAPKGGNGYTPDDIKRFDEKDRRIAREAALHAVTRLYGGEGTEFGSIIVLAERAVNWIYSGQDAALPQAAQPTPPKSNEAEMERAAEEVFPREDDPKKIITRIAGITYKEINGGQGKRFTVKTSGDEIYYTFSETLARSLKKSGDAQNMVALVVKKTEYGNEIVQAADYVAAKGEIAGAPVTVPS